MTGESKPLSEAGWVDPRIHAMDVAIADTWREEAKRLHRENLNLIATIRERDREIAELKRGRRATSSGGIEP